MLPFAPEFCGMMEQIERRRVVRACLRVTRGTACAADYYEVRLLVEFIQGRLTIDQVCNLTDEWTVRSPVNKVSNSVLVA